MKEYHFKDFSIYLGNDVFEELLENLIRESYSKVFVLVDDHTQKYCLPRLSKYLFDFHKIVIRSGEQFKNLETAQTIWDALQKNNADRRAVLINLGGGVVGDIGGFCASTYKRGIDFINIPTTLLSMVDSSVGGKTGIDYNHVKNAIGTIQQPRMVYVDPAVLNTLPPEEFMSGYAEMLKHGLIADAEYWERMCEAGDGTPADLINLIGDSIKIKTKIVKRDPFEKDERKVLNFGHTIGHALEAYSLINDKTPLKHGEAVAIGIVCEAYLSKLNAGLSSKELKDITEIILSKYKKYSLRNILSPELIRIMRQDKKNVGNSLNFTLLKRIGKATINKTCSESEVALALNYYDGL